MKCDIDQNLLDVIIYMRICAGPSGSHAHVCRSFRFTCACLQEFPVYMRMSAGVSGLHAHVCRSFRFTCACLQEFPVHMHCVQSFWHLMPEMRGISFCRHIRDFSHDYKTHILHVQDAIKSSLILMILRNVHSTHA